jgi:hypothetical protein
MKLIFNLPNGKGSKKKEFKFLNTYDFYKFVVDVVFSISSICLQFECFMIELMCINKF